MKPSQRKIKQELKKLRAFMESRDESLKGQVEARVAYAMHRSIQWATEDTDLDSPRESVISNARCLLLVDVGPKVASAVNNLFTVEGAGK